jgi:hypothetical protein
LATEALTRLGAVIADAAQALDELGKSWGLVGGLAIAVRAEPRFTRDIDLAVAVESDRDAEQLVFALSARGYAPRALVEHEVLHRLATARLNAPVRFGAGLVVDLLFASSGIEPEIAAAAERLEVLPGFAAPVARAGHLVAQKLLARDDAHRPQDAADLASLRRTIDSAEIERARVAVKLIASRGFDRGRDLDALLEVWLQPKTAGGA